MGLADLPRDVLALIASHAILDYRDRRSVASACRSLRGAVDVTACRDERTRFARRLVWDAAGAEVRAARSHHDYLVVDHWTASCFQGTALCVGGGGDRRPLRFDQTGRDIVITFEARHASIADLAAAEGGACAAEAAAVMELLGAFGVDDDAARRTWLTWLTQMPSATPAPMPVGDRLAPLTTRWGAHHAVVRESGAPRLQLWRAAGSAWHLAWKIADDEPNDRLATTALAALLWSALGGTEADVIRALDIEK